MERWGENRRGGEKDWYKIQSLFKANLPSAQMDIISYLVVLYYTKLYSLGGRSVAHIGSRGVSAIGRCWVSSLLSPVRPVRWNHHRCTRQVFRGARGVCLVTNSITSNDMISHDITIPIRARPAYFEWRICELLAKSQPMFERHISICYGEPLRYDEKNYLYSFRILRRWLSTSYRQKTVSRSH